MKMHNKYISKHKTINQAIEHIDNFDTVIKRFQSKYPWYIYTINYKKVKDEWNVEITIKNEKKLNTKTTNNSVRTYSVL